MSTEGPIDGAIDGMEGGGESIAWGTVARAPREAAAPKRRGEAILPLAKTEGDVLPPLAATRSVFAAFGRDRSSKLAATLIMLVTPGLLSPAIGTPRWPSEFWGGATVLRSSGASFTPCPEGGPFDSTTCGATTGPALASVWSGPKGWQPPRIVSRVAHSCSGRFWWRTRFRRGPCAGGSRGTHSRPSRRQRWHASVKMAPHATFAVWQLRQARLRGCPRSDEQSRPRRRHRLQGRWSVQAVFDARQCRHACSMLRLASVASLAPSSLFGLPWDVSRATHGRVDTLASESERGRKASLLAASIVDHALENLVGTHRIGVAGDPRSCRRFAVEGAVREIGCHFALRPEANRKNQFDLDSPHWTTANCNYRAVAGGQTDGVMSRGGVPLSINPHPNCPTVKATPKAASSLRRVSCLRKLY